MEHPLDGLRVLDLSRVVAGPFAGRMLSDLGADVVKIEPPAGDLSRVWGEKRHGLSGFYTQQNAGKRNVGVDMGADGGSDIVLALAGVADILVENFRPGVLDRLGLGWETLHARNPALIVLSISGFGQDGPGAARQAYAPVIHAESGLLERQARFDGARPSDPMLSIADFTAGLHGLVAVLAALHQRQRTGRGQRVDLAMMDAMVATDDYAHHALDGSPVVRLGGEVWDAPGGPLMIAGVFSTVWRALSGLFSIPDPAREGDTRESRQGDRRAVLGAWLLEFPERDGLKAALDMAGLAWADVRAASEVFSSDTPTAREMGVAVDDRGGGLRRVVQSPYRFSDAVSGVRGGAPHLGEHNGEVLGEWLGWDRSAVAAAVATGALIADPVAVER